MREVDVAIIGAGTAGLSARREVQKVTENYVVIDDGILGTTCARVGCMPSKVLIHTANEFFNRKHFSTLGIQGAEHLNIDSKAVMDHVRSLRDRFVRGVISGMESWRADKLIAKRARFIDKNTLDLGDEKIRAKSIIIAAGSKPIVPDAWKPYQKYFIDTDGFFELESLPEKVAVIGLGVIGLELGQAMNRLGVQVHGFSRSKAIGGLSDPELQEYAARTFEKEFPISYAGADVVGERDGKVVIRSGDTEQEFDRVFLSMGRAPSLKDMHLEAAGIELQANGIPVFEKSTYQIPGTRIFIAGDINGQRTILHEAADEGRIAGYNAVRDSAECFRRRELLAITFSDPNIAVVGRTHQLLTEAGTKFVTGTISYEGFGRAIILQKEVGLVHIYADPKDGKLLGAELFAPGAEHMAHLLAWSINFGLTVHQALSMPFYHPVLEEGLRAALRDAQNKVKSKPGKLEVIRCDDPPVGIHAR